MAILNKFEERKLVAAIGAAERLTSGEIRIHFEKHTDKDTYERALEVFAQLEMHQTELRNGVLFYLAYEDHKFTILGDEGIHAKVGNDFWNTIKEDMQTAFRQGKFFEGLESGVLEAGRALQEFFPRMDDDVNELSDEISKS